MRIGVSSYWFNRGQATVGRHLRSALDELGHETFVLARPAKSSAAKPAHISSDDIWDAEGVTYASQYEIPLEEMLGWATGNQLDVAFFDQNYQFDEIAKLRESGVTTIGRFVWEQFSAEHVADAQRAFDVIYSVIACEQDRYRFLGIDSPRVRWGIHPELLENQTAVPPGGSRAELDREPVRKESRGFRDRLYRLGNRLGTPPVTTDQRRSKPRARTNGGRTADEVVLLFPGGYMTKRKPLEPVIEAFVATTSPELRLVIKAQVQKKIKKIRRLIGGDGRVEIIVDDMPHDEFMALFASADVVLAPSRWEGLGLHLYEAMGLGIPIITNDNPPMNEVIVDGENGLLVPGIEMDEAAPSGIPAFDPDVAALTAAIERVADPDELARLKAGAVASRERLSWQHTLDDLAALLGAGIQ